MYKITDKLKEAITRHVKIFHPIINGKSREPNESFVAQVPISCGNEVKSWILFSKNKSFNTYIIVDDWKLTAVGENFESVKKRRKSFMVEFVIEFYDVDRYA